MKSWCWLEKVVIGLCVGVCCHCLSKRNHCCLINPTSSCRTCTRRAGSSAIQIAIESDWIHVWPFYYNYPAYNLRIDYPGGWAALRFELYSKPSFASILWISVEVFLVTQFRRMSVTIETSTAVMQDLLLSFSAIFLIGSANQTQRNKRFNGLILLANTYMLACQCW